MNENVKLGIAVLIAVMISLGLTSTLFKPQMGPQGIQGIQGEVGPQGEPGESIIGPQGVPGDPAFSWMSLDSIDVVWELRAWGEDLSKHETEGGTFNITGSVWWVDITISQQEGTQSKISVYNTNREEGAIDWYTVSSFSQHRILMVGPGEYSILVYCDYVHRVDIVVKQELESIS